MGRAPSKPTASEGHWREPACPAPDPGGGRDPCRPRRPPGLVASLGQNIAEAPLHASQPFIVRLVRREVGLLGCVVASVQWNRVLLRVLVRPACCPQPRIA